MTTGSPASLIRGRDPAFAGSFVFSVDGLLIGEFSEVSGLSAEIAVETVQEGGQNEFEHKLPGRMSWPNLVLKRGMTNNEGLFNWFRKSSGEGFAGAGHKLTRTTGVLMLLRPNGRTLREWSFYDAFPVRWNGPSLASASTDIATEELEIAHHGFRAE
ncbi:MAG: phage tail protein [Dehalococcoidia bacterium]